MTWKIMLIENASNFAAVTLLFVPRLYDVVRAYVQLRRGVISDFGTIVVGALQLLRSRARTCARTYARVYAAA